MAITKRDVLLVLFVVPAIVVLAWPLLLWLDRKIMAASRWLAGWLMTEDYEPAPRKTASTNVRHQLCACCGHRKTAHENGVDSCVAEGCDCRGFSDHDAG